MLTANKLLPQGQSLSPVLLKRAASVELDWDVRQKSRFAATDSQGRQLAVFLPRGQAVRGGDVLVAEDGSLIRVLAAPQRVLRITACAKHGSPFDLMRAAYHLGNRHVPIELQPDHLKIEPDHVLADLLRSMHMTVVEAELPFEPEAVTQHLARLPWTWALAVFGVLWRLSAGDQVDLMAAPGQGERLGELHHIHATGIAGAGRAGRRGVHRYEAHTQRVGVGGNYRGGHAASIAAGGFVET